MFSMEGPAAGHDRNLALDGLRGVAVLMVTVAHSNVPLMRFGGTVGVTVFFVLSGYLITTILRRELDVGGGVGFRRFYIRRALRLLPALVVALVLGGAVSVVVAPDDAGDVAIAALHCLLYVSNLHPLTEVQLGPFGHYWSLAMEEQFYMVWPIVLLAFRRAGSLRLAVGLLVAASVSLALRFAGDFTSAEGYTRAYHLPHTNGWAILLGSALALALAGGWRPSLPRWGVPVATAVVGGAATLLGLATGIREDPGATSYTLRLAAGPIAALGAVVLVYAAVQGDRAVAWLELRWLTFFGTISYGLYLWHGVLDHALTDRWGTNEVRAVLTGGTAAVLATGAAVLSMRLVEAPALRLKRRYSAVPQET